MEWELGFEITFPLYISQEEREDDDIPFNIFEEDQQLRVEEIIAKGIPSPPRNYTHYYMNMEDESTLPTMENTLPESTESRGIGQFLRIPQIEVPISARARIEPLIGYSQL